MSGRLSDPVREVLSRHWGFDSLRPLQSEAIEATLQGRDAIVVLPTGGGKSLCYQLPPLVLDRLTIVVSPLIALMQDQIAALKLAGVPAAALHSNIAPEESREIRASAVRGELRVLLVAPERLLQSGFMTWARSLRKNMCAIAIDESHCISQWGHDFRQEYRRLSELRDSLPDVPIQAYTATATPRVRSDIIEQLRLKDHVELVGCFDRPNLTYRMLARESGRRFAEQLASTLKPHAGRGAIVYCISRRDTEAIAESLSERGINAKAYHAGMTGPQRERVQSAFRREKLDVVVATVAFGMGIDRSDVRCVIHAAMPQTIEHYQQETGRAGRDGLAAECVLFYSHGDAARWKRIIASPSEDGEGKSPEALEAQLVLLDQMQRLVNGLRCRHRALSEYFGQSYPHESCHACDMCLTERTTVDGGNEIAMKILSCIARVKERFGAGYIADVLTGKATERVRSYGHTTLSTFGLLKHLPRDAVMAYIGQLVDGGVIERTTQEYPVLMLNARSWAVMKGQEQVQLLGSIASEEGAQTTEAPLSEEESALFEYLRKVRRRIAEQLGVPPYIVFSDDTLQSIARVRPGSEFTLASIRGIGQRKLEKFGAEVLDSVRRYCLEAGLELDAFAKAREAPKRKAGAIPAQAERLFEQGTKLEEVALALGRARSTTASYLETWVARAKPRSIDPWVDAATYEQVRQARADLGPGPFRSLFERLDGKVPYETIRVVVTHLEHASGA